MTKSLAALQSLAVVFIGAFALSTQPLEAKTSRTSSLTARNYIVPAPPPDTLIVAAVVPSALRLTSEPKTSRSISHRARNYFVPPPPPYTPSLVPSTLGMTYSQAVLADAGDAGVDKPVNLQSKYIFTRNQVDMPQVAQPNPYLTYNRGVETKIQKHIESFDSEISSIEKEIGKLLHL